MYGVMVIWNSGKHEFFSWSQDVAESYDPLMLDLYDYVKSFTQLNDVEHAWPCQVEHIVRDGQIIKESPNG